MSGFMEDVSEFCGVNLSLFDAIYSRLISIMVKISILLD